MTLARDLGNLLPRATYVLAGPDRRHIETAVAMGYSVDEIIDWPSGYVSGVVDHHDQRQWERPFERYAELLEASSALRDVAEQHLTHWHRALDEVAEGGTVLVVSSGGSIEPVLVAACPGGHVAHWGMALQHLQGASLEFVEGKCEALTMRR